MSAGRGFSITHGSGIDPATMTEALRAMFGQSAPISINPDGSVSYQWDPNSQYAVTKTYDGVDNLLKEGADFMRGAEFDRARSKYREAIDTIVDGYEVPLNARGGGGVRSTKYIHMDRLRMFALMGCCNEMAQCLLKQNKIEEALVWLEEVNVICKNTFIEQSPPIFDWFDFNMQHQDYFKHRATALVRASDVLFALGNTSAASHRMWTASININSIPETSPINKAALEKIVPVMRMKDRISVRHPEPMLTMNLTLTEPALQVRGSWRKIDLKSGARILPRLAFASFVWQGKFYVCGGQKSALGPFYQDMQCLDLRALDGWRTLAAPPTINNGILIGYKMLVHEGEDKAYLFSGRRLLHYFDLRSETWHSVQTTWPGESANYWPFPKRDLVDYSMIIVNGKLYVFGGTHSTCHVGTNYWMVLDPMTREWRKLSGDPGPLRADFDTPGPRRHAGLWVDGRKDRIWLLFGEADRASAQTMKEQHGAEIGFGHDDCWSWDITSETWRRERIAGNPPCPRSEFACTYNSKLDKVFVFGGYCPNLPTMYPGQNDKFFQFSYYGDTFMFDPATSGDKPPTWKHVLTRGFPTYRAQARLFSDPETGKVYLFGGYTNSDFVTDAKHPMSRSFGDLWQLRLDMPGGFFDGVNIEEEARTARAGPWQRCFTCGSAGPWKKCGGSCGGRAFFCENQCLREGWKEHKERHNCSKK